MKEDSIINKLELHYFFEENDSSHTMDAFVRNKCEYELLQIYSELQREFELDIKVETEAFEEGGLTEFWTLLSENTIQINLLLTSLIVILSRIPQRKTRLERQDLELSIQERILNIKTFKQNIKETENLNTLNIENLNLVFNYNPKIIKHVSNYYKLLHSYPKVKKISTTKLNWKKEKMEESLFVQRTDFDKFILESDELDSIIDENATIEIISPVLKKGKYKWKGIYSKVNGPIDFYMKDYLFKQNVVAEGIEFKNGTFIECVLEISRKINEIGDIYNSSYSVLTVLKKHDENIVTETIQGKKYRQEKEAVKRQFNLFDNKAKLE